MARAAVYRCCFSYNLPASKYPSGSLGSRVIILSATISVLSSEVLSFGLSDNDDDDDDERIRRCVWGLSEGGSDGSRDVDGSSDFVWDIFVDEEACFEKKMVMIAEQMKKQKNKCSWQHIFFYPS